MNMHVASPAEAIPADAAANRKAPSPEDFGVGGRVKAFREARGLSQTALGHVVGVTFQQIQKYERGKNRIGAGRLHQIARALEVPVAALFADDPSAEAASPAQELYGLLGTPGLIEVLRDFAGIPDPAQRRAVQDFVRAARRAATPAAPTGEAP